MKVILKLSCAFLLCAFISNVALAQEPYQIGDKVADFELKSTAGEMISLASYEDVKGYIVVFTCNHCPYAVMYEDRLIAIHKEYGNDYPIVAINPNDPEVNEEDSFELMQERALDKAFPFNYLFDDGQKIYPLFGAKKTPEVYLLDADKTIHYMGAIDDSPRDEESVEKTYLIDAIKALAAGEEINPNKTKAIGCSIKYKK